ncbi:DUF6318 family protein [Demequina activiva]|uniref:DUF6318 domain-containing protein n=1 Tax=Demequina activiva TaxID=1582364 RepID=A0A919Q1V1_9MICO|nr:DUF6318 family protein [Demequina activiva]GIG53361.1 hypothetical protein Dac01nite_01130 [Demequina activiva]
MIRRGWGVGAAALAAAVVMAGCNGDPEPVVTPSPTPTETASETPAPTPTPSPTPTALTEEEILAAIPEAARSQDFPGAQEFARFFLVAANDAMADGSSVVVDALATSSCVYCANLRELVSRTVDENITVRGGDLDLGEGLPTGGLQENGLWRIEFESETAQREFLDENGVVVATDEAQSANVTVLLTWDSGHWAVVDVDAQELTV